VQKRPRALSTLNCFLSTADSNLRGAFERKEIEAYDKDGHPVSRFAQLGRDPPYRFESEAVRKLWPRPGPSSIDVLHLLKEDKTTSLPAMLEKLAPTEEGCEKSVAISLDGIGKPKDWKRKLGRPSVKSDRAKKQLEKMLKDGSLNKDDLAKNITVTKLADMCDVSREVMTRVLYEAFGIRRAKSPVGKYHD
jgi:hypothetical protein